jgi:hypothetical protein
MNDLSHGSRFRDTNTGHSECEVEVLPSHPIRLIKHIFINQESNILPPASFYFILRANIFPNAPFPDALHLRSVWGLSRRSLWRMCSSGSLHNAVRRESDVSEERKQYVLPKPQVLSVLHGVTIKKAMLFNSQSEHIPSEEWPWWWWWWWRVTVSSWHNSSTHTVSAR